MQRSASPHTGHAAAFADALTTRLSYACHVCKAWHVLQGGAGAEAAGEAGHCMPAVEARRHVRGLGLGLGPSASAAARCRRRQPPAATELLYVSNGDGNGVFRHLGTGYGRHSWVNPVLAGLVQVCAARRSSRLRSAGGRNMHSATYLARHRFAWLCLVLPLGFCGQMCNVCASGQFCIYLFALLKIFQVGARCATPAPPHCASDPGRRAGAMLALPAGAERRASGLRAP